MKCDVGMLAKDFNMSPSVWREWIEMSGIPYPTYLKYVSLRVEGVD